MFKLNNLCPAETHESITAIDEDKDHHTQMLNVTMPHNKAQTGGLVRTLQIAIGAKVMLTNNVDVSDGLVNGARGLVTAIIKHQNTVLSILVTFNNPRIGAKAIAQSHYRRDYPTAVPIQRYEAVFSIGKNKAAQVSRRQYPLVLAWATTIHKVQGLTLDKIVVDMNNTIFEAGQAYVAFSRVKTLQGLFIKNFNPTAIKTSIDVTMEMSRLSTHTLPTIPLPQVVSLPKQHWMKIGHLNVHSYIAKQEDIIKDEAMQYFMFFRNIS